MEATNHKPPGFTTLTGRIARTAAGALRSRGELFAVEWQTEKMRLTELLLWAGLLVFLATMGLVLVTGIAIFLFKEEHRIYAAGGFAVVYTIGAVLAWLSLKSLLQQEPFADTIDQARKDTTWLASFK